MIEGFEEFSRFLRFIARTNFVLGTSSRLWTMSRRNSWSKRSQGFLLLYHVFTRVYFFLFFFFLRSSLSIWLIDHVFVSSLIFFDFDFSPLESIYHKSINHRVTLEAHKKIYESVYVTNVEECEWNYKQLGRNRLSWPDKSRSKYQTLYEK